MKDDLPAQQSGKNNSHPPSIGFFIFAGLLFAVVRFLLGALFITMFAKDLRRDPQGRDVLAAAWYVTVGGTIVAGLTGGLMWRRLGPRIPSTREGAYIGFISAISSYFGAALGGAVAAAIHGQLEDAVCGFLICGIGSGIYTSILVVPGLTIMGVVLSSGQGRAAKGPK